MKRCIFLLSALIIAQTAITQPKAVEGSTDFQRSSQPAAGASLFSIHT